MDNKKQSFLQLFERMEGFRRQAARLPCKSRSCRKSTPLKDLFLRQRAPRLVLTGDPPRVPPGLFNAIFSAPVAPFAADADRTRCQPRPGGRISRTPGAGCCGCWTPGSATPDRPHRPPCSPRWQRNRRTFSSSCNRSAADQTRGRSGRGSLGNAFLDAAEKAHGRSGRSVLPVVVSASEGEVPSWIEIEAARAQTQQSAHEPAATDRDATWRRLRRSGTFMRFRLDGTFDPEQRPPPRRRRRWCTRWWRNCPTRRGWKWRGSPGRGRRRRASRRRS